MGIVTNKLNRSFSEFIERQKLFFVATAAAQGRVNLSPKGLDCLRVINNKQIVWLSVSGSGNETSAHINKHPRMTLMFCAFEGEPLILRVYGSAKVYYPRHDGWQDYLNIFPEYAGARSIYRLDIEQVTTSCGTGVPEMTLLSTRAERDLLPWYDNLGPARVEEFWRKKNVRSIDGYPTGIFEDVER